MRKTIPAAGLIPPAPVTVSFRPVVTIATIAPSPPLVLRI
jgi:hypothetical protein